MVFPRLRGRLSDPDLRRRWSNVMTIAQKNLMFFAGLLIMAVIVTLAPAQANAPTLDMDTELCPTTLG
jgi:uncharacterized membrane protein